MSDSEPDIPENLSRSLVAQAMHILGVTDERITEVVISGESVEFTFPVRRDNCEPTEVDEILPPERFLTVIVPIVS